MGDAPEAWRDAGWTRHCRVPTLPPAVCAGPWLVHFSPRRSSVWSVCSCCPALLQHLPGPHPGFSPQSWGGLSQSRVCVLCPCSWHQWAPASGLWPRDGLSASILPAPLLQLGSRGARPRPQQWRGVPRPPPAWPLPALRGESPASSDRNAHPLSLSRPASSPAGSHTPMTVWGVTTGGLRLTTAPAPTPAPPPWPSSTQTTITRSASSSRG